MMIITLLQSSSSYDAPSVKGTVGDSTRRPQPMPAAMLVGPSAIIASMASVIVSLVEVRGVNGAMEQ
jgi:hypothetical protein